MQTLYTFTFSDVWDFKENSMEVLQHLYTLDVCAFALVLYQIVTLFFGREKSSENVEHLQSNNAGTKICHSIITLYTYIDFERFIYAIVD